MKKLMLKKLRVAISLCIFIPLTFQVHALANIQFIPAWLSRNIAAMVFLLVCTLLFGRVYCSFICPMGVFQDIANRRSKSKYRKNNWVLRCSILAIFLVLFNLGYTIAVGLLDPYSAYGRITTHLFKPVYLFVNNLLADVFNYTFYKIEIVMSSIFSFVVALLTFVVIGAMAWAKGRLYCNTICPVGTIFGFMNKFSLFKIRIDKDKCTSCGICEKKCKASCINAKTVDYSQCVNCFNCLNNCNKKAISYATSKPNVDKSKRRFLLTGLTVAVAAPAAFAQSKTRNAISPPGAISAEHLQKRCTSCHLCISKCPSKVLKPAFMEYGIAGMMMPVMYFEKGFCNYDCIICANVCPNNALTSLTVEQKHRLQVGKVVFAPELCVVNTKGTSCGACSEHCPTQAVKMIPYKNGLTIPFVDSTICVGCGGCEFICPVRPNRAIYVEGNRVHQEARAFDVEKKEEREIMDFGF